ncbi:glycerophosphodiester phosphodiesterase [Brevibacillus ginsengisoli]|uniref:glycerophosphodiester phosphodiesterase n=1 Tax=Brevibacillus ginsengisoli TaxID=363854 RepID=UPI003CF80B08
MYPEIYAHRGASGLYPENTLEAFRAAYRLGADGIELDVQLSADNQVVVIHDAVLGRTTNGRGLVRSHTLVELKQLSAGEWLHPRYRLARVPSFEEVCAFIHPTQLRMIIEMKNFLTTQPLLEEKVLEILDLYQLQERVIFSSFNFNSLLQIKRLMPKMKTGLLYVGAMKDPWQVAREYRTDQIHAPLSEITPKLIKEAHARNLQVYAWTVNGSHRMKSLQQKGIDGIITNYPGRARRTIRKK